jgi:hypothetical protein
LEIKREADAKQLQDLEIKREADAKKVAQLERKTGLLRLLSHNKYAGISKEVEFVEDWDMMAVLGDTLSLKNIQGLWKECAPLRTKLNEYDTLSFKLATEREPWLQLNVFIPLLILLKVAGQKFRLHGNNARLYHSHNSTYSVPDATLTHRDQLVMDVDTCGPVFELEYTMLEENPFDKQNHFLNGQGQVLQYLATLALGVDRPRYLGYLTDCRSLVGYQLLSEALTFSRSQALPLLTDASEPTAGFAALVCLFATDPDALGLPDPGTGLQFVENFKGFPHFLELPITLGAKDKVQLQFEGALGFGAASCTFKGRWMRQENVCIKIEMRVSGKAADGQRGMVAQISNEIAILPALQGIPGIPTMVWSRNALAAQSPLGKVLVTGEVGVLLNKTLADLSGVYVFLKDTLARVHAIGYCHHDVSPNNIILVTPGTPMLIDWGLASRRGQCSIGFSGNPLFSSVRYDAAISSSQLARYQYTPEDDLESLIYSICYVHHGLPWGDMRVAMARAERKARCSTEEICGELHYLIPDLFQLRQWRA